MKQLAAILAVSLALPALAIAGLAVRPPRPDHTWNVAVCDGDDYLVWQTKFASRRECLARVAAIMERYPDVVFSCAEVFSKPLPFRGLERDSGPARSRPHR